VPDRHSALAENTEFRQPQPRGCLNAGVPRPRRSLGLFLVGCFLFALPAATSSATSRVAYPAKLSVTGGLTITTVHDFTSNCGPGQAWTIQAEAEVNIHGRIEVEVIGNKQVQSTAAITPGGAVNTNTLTNFHETNYCPPDEPVSQDPPPVCKRHTGSGGASLSLGRAPWLVSLGIGRKGGGEQDQSCIGAPVIGPKPTGAQIEALQSDYESIVLPLDLKPNQFKGLRVGKKLSSRIKVNGPCKRTTATASTFRDDVCTVSGSFAAVVKRLPGKGRGINVG
jgi:hypothetical protein